MVGSSRRGRGKRRRITEDEQVEDMSAQSHPASRQFTHKIIRTLDDFETFTTSSTHGSTLVRRLLDKEGVYTRREPTQTSERHLSPISRTQELEDQDHSHSLLEIGSSDSTSQGKEEQHYVGSPLYLKSGSHKSNSAEKDNAMDDVFKRALVAVGTEHNTSLQLESSNSQMEVPAVNLPAIIFLPWYATENNASNSHEDSHHGYPCPTDVHENFGSSSTNNGSKEMAIEKSKTLPASSLNTAQIAEEMAFGTNFEADSMESDSAAVSFNGYDYKVKAQYAGVLPFILEKYGDICANSSMQSVTVRTVAMELVCEIFQTLENTNFKVITKDKLESMMAYITDLETERVDVGWLRKRFDLISEAREATLELQASSNLKKRRDEQLAKVEMIMKQLEEDNRAIVDLQKKVDLAEAELSVAKTQLLETEYSISEKKARMKYVY